uniref:Uncharacterized protein n=1 Tax=Trypanosoma congolense (strain IL3000) TaxID=1068625 RepID=G0ULT1_TRYCI|nr:hypothetical protein, unlikely [Trypanosoma congolense IL3000]
MLFNEMLCHIFEVMSSVWAFGTDFSGGVSGLCSMFSLYFCSSVSVSVTVHRLRHPARTYTLYFLNIFIYRESDIFIQLLMCGSSFFFFWLDLFCSVDMPHWFKDSPKLYSTYISEILKGIICYFCVTFVIRCERKWLLSES